MAQEAATLCDHLAAHPEDPDRIVEGVPTAAVDKPAAIAACEAGLAADPGNPRLTYQLARVYFYNGRSGDAVVAMEKSALAGYRQAQFVMGALISNKRPDASDNICDAEMWWAKSAVAGRLAAQISYVRHVTKGFFDGCKLHANKDDMTVFLDNVRATGGRDYYLRLLMADLTEDLAAYRSD
ncbi:MAG: hypothetical protein GKS03_05230 [Alphaproteobacteria bacterium]|nr:hypothetical protein [Alphaproteobacteria bacterium]